MSRVLVAAGEASGDLHAARLLAALRRRRPDVQAVGLGGDQLAEAGARLLAHSSEIAVTGITEALRILGRAREIFQLLVDEVERQRPDVAVLVDFPEFNLRLARALKERGVPVVYYVSPQIWAWRRGRVKTIERFVDRMLVLFPFEKSFYADHGVDVAHVGHPLVDEVPMVESAWERDAHPSRWRLVLLPGSRRNEVSALLPSMLEAARRMGEEEPIDTVVVRAPTVPRELLDAHIEASGVRVEVSSENRFEVIASSHLALCASGTATLEVAMLGTPLVVLYRVSLASYLLGRLLVRVPAVSLVNLVLGDRVVPELLQGASRGDRVAGVALGLLHDRSGLERMRRRLADVRPRLGASGASDRAAEEVAAWLPSPA